MPYSWTHVAGTYNPSGGVGTLYVNGVSVGTPVSGGNVNGGPNSAGNYSITNAYNYIGVYSPGSSPSYFTGYMTDFRYTLKSIVYTTPFVPPQAPLTATTNNTTMLLNFTNGGVIDYHTNNVLETVGNAQLSTGLKQFGNASMSFDGSTSYLVGPPDPSGTFAAGNLTIECWVYFNNVSTNPQIIAQVTNGSSASNYSWQLYLSAASTLTGVIWSSATNYAVSTTVVAGQWYYVALVRNGTTVSLYLNGVSVGTPSTIGTNAMNWFSDSRFYAGRNSTAIHYFNGYLDELRVTKGIARYTSSPFAVPTAAFQTI